MSTVFGVSIFDKHGTVLAAGVRAVLTELSDITCALYSDEPDFLKSLRADTSRLAFVVVKDAGDLHAELLERLKVQFPRVRTVVVAPQASRDVVVEAIRCGAKGLIAGDAGAQELREATYQVTGGYEYFSNSITGLLLGEYVESIRAHSTLTSGDLTKLSRREVEILTMWGDGKTNAEIADNLFISVRTVESHKNHIMQKLGMRTTVDLLKFAIRNNLARL